MSFAVMGFTSAMRFALPDNWNVASIILDTYLHQHPFIAKPLEILVDDPGELPAGQLYPYLEVSVKRVIR